MIKNEENKKVTGSDIINNSNDFNSSTRPTSFQKENSDITKKNKDLNESNDINKKNNELIVKLKKEIEIIKKNIDEYKKKTAYKLLQIDGKLKQLSLNNTTTINNKIKNNNYRRKL